MANDAAATQVDMANLGDTREMRGKRKAGSFPDHYF
jgi:hypothetical protein